MAVKFSRIVQAGRLQAELTAYQEWLTGKGERQPNIGTKGNRPALQPLYVEPFGINLPSSVLVKQSGQSSAWTEYEVQFGDHTVATTASGVTSISLRGYRAPRVNIITGRSTQGTVKTSHITGAKYLSYGGKSVSLPFGKDATDATEEAAYATIKGALTNIKTYLIPEKL